MVNIVYTRMRGSLVGIWPGKSIRKKGIGSRKIGQIYLGKVIDIEKGIFWTRERGYYTFNPIDQSFGEVAQNDVPMAFEEPNKRKRCAPVIVDFGDAYFLHQLINGMGYDRVLDTIEYQNRDSFRAALSYYTLESGANCHAEPWCRQNFASFLYPRANLASQRFSAMLDTIGRPENIRRFLLAHIQYLSDVFGDDLCVLIDSSGMKNDCNLPVTSLSNHNGEISLEFRLVVIVQKSTGIPLFYECIPGNIVDISTLKRIIVLLEEHGCRIEYCIADAGYLCPSNIERLVLSGIEFMSRLNPMFVLYKESLNAHFDELEDPSNIVRYKDRLVHIVKIPSVIATDKDTGERTTGFIFLCMDIQSAHSKSDHLLSSKVFARMTTNEYFEAQQRFGVFAIVTTRDLSPELVLPEYYIRQYAEQYFDYGKNYAKFLPVRQHTMETLSGHLLLAFIASFLIIVVKNRLAIQDLRYVALPPKLVSQENSDGTNEETILEQDPLIEIFAESPATLFRELRGQKADVFQGRIVPSCPVKKANDFYHAFGIESPTQIIRNGEKLSILSEAESTISKELVFTQCPCSTDEEILAKRAKREKAKASGEEKKQSSCGESASTKRGRGRPPGSKNKKTLELGAALAANSETTSDNISGNISGNVVKKLRRGRPPGSKNKKTLEREATQAANSESHSEQKK